MQPQLLDYHLSDHVRAFSTTRIGGVGEGTYAGFNITHYCGDSDVHVQENRALLCRELGLNDAQLILPRQTHGIEVIDIDDDFLKMSDAERKYMLEGKDAVVTAIPGICIGVSTADCVPVLLYDEVQKVAAAVHAGWRGTLQKIVSVTIDWLLHRYGVNPAHLKAVIGPSISLESFEVGVEVYRAFEDAHFPMPLISRFYPEASGDTVYQGNKGKWHIDLWAANCMQLEECGVDLENIQVANVCTLQHADSFFSARKLGINSGRIFNGIMIK